MVAQYIRFGANYRVKVEQGTTGYLLSMSQLIESRAGNNTPTKYRKDPSPQSTKELYLRGKAEPISLIYDGTRFTAREGEELKSLFKVPTLQKADEIITFDKETPPGKFLDFLQSLILFHKKKSPSSTAEQVSTRNKPTEIKFGKWTFKVLESGIEGAENAFSSALKGMNTSRVSKIKLDSSDNSLNAEIFRVIQRESITKNFNLKVTQATDKEQSGLKFEMHKTGDEDAARTKLILFLDDKQIKNKFTPKPPSPLFTNLLQYIAQLPRPTIKTDTVTSKSLGDITIEALTNQPMSLLDGSVLLENGTRMKNSDTTPVPGFCKYALQPASTNGVIGAVVPKTTIKVNDDTFSFDLITLNATNRKDFSNLAPEFRITIPVAQISRIERRRDLPNALKFLITAAYKERAL